MDEILQRYDLFIKRIARSTYKSSQALSIEDLYQVGCLAAVNAFQTHDPGQGSTLASYIRSSIRHAIFREASLYFGIFNLPANILSILSKLHKLSLEGKTDAQIIDTLGIDREQVQSFKHLLGNRFYSQLSEDIENPVDLTYEQIISLLSQIELSKVQKTVFTNRFLKNVPMNKLAKKLNLTTAHLYVIERQVRDKLKEALFE